MASFLLFCVALWAGAQNALAGGGSFVTLPALMLTGMDARAANITSTIALFPGQVATAWAGRSLVSSTEAISERALILISLAGGVLGALLLTRTPASIFEHLVPWLVLWATAVFAWGSFGTRKRGPRKIGRRSAAAIQFAIAVYGGYFGGGIGFLMLATLTLAGQVVRNAGATKNLLAATMNASAVTIFVFSPDVHWPQAVIVGAGAILGGALGTLILRKIDERLLRMLVVLIGLVLTIGLFLRSMA